MRVRSLAEDFIALMQNLPREPFDDIHDLVFALTTSSAPVEVTASYRSPSNLAVNKRTRQMLGQANYSSSQGFHFHRDAEEVAACAW